MTNRKTIKITIPADKVDAFAEAKETAQDSAMIELSDTQYASRLIQWAIKMQSPNSARVEVRNEGGFIFARPKGVINTEAFTACLEIMKAWEESMEKDQ